MNPLVTASIRTYNRANLLPRAIESILNQTYQNLELIILDDCSTDNTAELIKKYQDIDSRIKYIRHNTNKGTGAGFNTINRTASGKYVAYLDDDDIWLPKKLELQVAKMEQMGEKYGLITGGVLHINGDTEKILSIFKPKYQGNIYWDMLKFGSGLIVGPPSVIMLRALAIRRMGDFDKNMPRGCGQDYFRRLAKQYKITYVNDICLKYYVHKNRITTHNTIEDVRNEIKARTIKLSHIGKDLIKLPNAYVREMRMLGHFYCLNNQMAEGRSCLLKAIRVNKKFKLRLLLLIALILSFCGKPTYTYFYKTLLPRLQILKHK